MRAISAFLLAWLCAPAAWAADLAPASDPRCGLLLSGAIDDTDAPRLIALIDSGAGDTTSICLDSPGGSLQGGMALYDAIMGYGLATYLRRDDTCLGACALAFLGGSEWGDYRYNSRTMEPGARLGFVTPLPDRFDDPAQAVAQSYDILRRLVQDQDMLGLSTEFLTGFLMTPSDQPHMVETLGDAAHAGVELALSGDKSAETDEGRANACAMAFALNTDAFADPDSDFEPYFEPRPDGNSSLPLEWSEVLIDGEPRPVVSSRHAWGTPWLTASCAFGPVTPGEDYIEATLWTNFIAEEPSFANALRVVRTGVPAWYLVAPETPLSGL